MFRLILFSSCLQFVCPLRKGFRFIKPNPRAENVAAFKRRAQPITKAEPVWHVPYYYKICLWRRNRHSATVLPPFSYRRQFFFKNIAIENWCHTVNTKWSPFSLWFEAKRNQPDGVWQPPVFISLSAERLESLCHVCVHLHLFYCFIKSI